jgi:hypothetical protein
MDLLGNPRSFGGNFFPKIVFLMMAMFTSMEYRLAHIRHRFHPPMHNHAHDTPCADQVVDTDLN